MLSFATEIPIVLYLCYLCNDTQSLMLGPLTNLKRAVRQAVSISHVDFLSRRRSCASPNRPVLQLLLCWTLTSKPIPARPAQTAKLLPNQPGESGNSWIVGCCKKKKTIRMYDILRTTTSLSIHTVPEQSGPSTVLSNAQRYDVPYCHIQINRHP